MSREAHAHLASIAIAMMTFSLPFVPMGCGKGDNAAAIGVVGQRPLNSLPRGNIAKCWVFISADHDLGDDVETWYAVARGDTLKTYLEDECRDAKQETRGTKFSHGVLRIDWEDGYSHSFTMCSGNIYDDVSQCYWTVDTAPLRELLRERSRRR